jgi:hypothetical protein
MFIGYEPAARGDGFDFGQEQSKALYDDYGKRAKPTAEIRRMAAEAIKGATTDAEKAAALARLARSRVRRVDVDTAAPADRVKLKATKNAGDVLSRGIGTADDVLLLFLSLAEGAGLDARGAALTSRSMMFSRSLRPHPAFTRERVAAVRSGTSWLFVDPANEHAESGQLPWDFELQRAYIADQREALTGDTPISPATYSVRKRSGTFRLLEDGTLEGEARIEYLGHWGEVLREQEDHETPATREQELRDLIVKRLPGAELTEVRIDNVQDPSKPYTNSYKVRVAGYAQRAGNRLIVQPAVFQKGVTQMFAATERKTGVHFPFAWSEDDVVTIELPSGYAPEAPVDQKGFDLGAAKYEPQLTIEGTRLVFKRGMTVATRGLVYSAPFYKNFREFFETVHRLDAQPFVLRKKDTQ